ncbi:aminomethyl-transferring glycine dehydrogenase subunit GcvPB [Candidatus Aminicenantes bacterium AC-708-M15]|jgi:glycine dehydrogenase subunit 2|nr:aminomethyl-transferring glycine dehydrogenase subunit GcvPB [SCandidatus Aminicenantes bacterium Aminicenantia_JdfR_composite]MCP2596908.1 aminomethyl-transferring glycine dehydrogenase subunit GcvPB [Candidatus Aminicenantes bacterium AC-335-G13]MCP2604222.1 aminomethyl-transferring glycine dehydrogenase subunit GcvPB [Candidatus Aminicenantes bacterium AC-708-M15]MCP2618813.1 aminomethyl-transferring glycine dehydrogenase subunit GcvPB [Candidatus Aminicenantes bacterium AC-335-A11]
MIKKEPLIFELSSEDKRAFQLPHLDVPAEKDILDKSIMREEIKGFPQLSENEIIRHFTRLSQMNYCVDIGLYPLGSCTMKYSPKINEKIALIPDFLNSHPYFPEELIQGNLEILKITEELLCEITGMDAFTLFPSAGAHGELTGMMIIRAYHDSKEERRKKVLIPDSAHGTNPASAHFSGYEIEEIPSNERGTVDVKKLKERINEDVAALMITNPNTLGVFEDEISEISEVLHSKGALLYMDGANLNALMGITRPREMGVDVIHLNLHKTFSTPHGGGGPGSGPVGVRDKLIDFLPIPRIEKKEGKYFLDYNRPKSIGRIRAFYGNFLVVIKALAYILSMGPEGLKRVSQIAVLNSNYIRKSLEKFYYLPYKSPTLHECVFSDKWQNEFGIKTLDIAKRLMDYGFHPPTIYFPLIVSGALMIEPTETESKQELDEFIQAMRKIAQEAKENPELLKSAPHKTPVRRLDEVRAARNLILKWSK